MRALLSQTHVSRCPIILGWRRRIRQGPTGDLGAAGEEREEKEDAGETERDENVWRRISIHVGVRGRALFTYLPYRMLRRLLGPPTAFAAGWAKDNLDFVLLTFGSDKHSVRRDRPPPRSDWRDSARVRILRKTTTCASIENARELRCSLSYLLKRLNKEEFAKLAILPLIHKINKIKSNFILILRLRVENLKFIHRNFWYMAFVL